MSCQRSEYMSKLEKPVTFNRDGKQMVGMLHVPRKTAPKYPAVLLLHGFTGNKAECHFLFTKLARALADAGFVCLRFDFLGSGDSQGEFEDMTILSELEDAKVGLKFLSEQPEVDTERIGVLGLSMGGCVAALLAGENLSLKSLVLWSAVARPDNFKRYLDEFPKQYRNDQNWYLDFNGFSLGKNFYEILPEVKPLESVQCFEGSALIIHGENDQSVPLTAAYDYQNVLNSRSQGTTELFTIENADHVFSSIPLTNQVISKTVAWFEKTL